MKLVHTYETNKLLGNILKLDKQQGQSQTKVKDMKIEIISFKDDESRG